jgi:hypothetical protein
MNGRLFGLGFGGHVELLGGGFVLLKYPEKCGSTLSSYASARSEWFVWVELG